MTVTQAASVFGRLAGYVGENPIEVRDKTGKFNRDIEIYVGNRLVWHDGWVVVRDERGELPTAGMLQEGE